MRIRDKEIDRLEKYAAGLGIKILWKKYERGQVTAAEWSTDGSEITVYLWAQRSKTGIILDLVHEFAHHMAWIAADKKTPIHIDRALEADANGEATKEHNRLIYEMEKSDAKYQERIFRELQLTIPIWKFKSRKKLDLWVYKRIWMTGKMPTEKQIRLKRQELDARFRRKYEAP
jgi:hypothetical protein